MLPMFFLKKFLPYRTFDMRNDLFLGLHIHKTAGVTLFRQVRHELRKDQYYCNSAYAVNYRQKSSELEERSSAELERIRFIFGHMCHEYVIAYFPEKTIKPFTFLREPIDRILSWYCYNKRLLVQQKRQPQSFSEFYTTFFPRHTMCSMLIRAFPSFIDQTASAPWQQALSILRKFYFFSTLQDFSQRAPLLYSEMGIHFSPGKKSNQTRNAERLLLQSEVIDYEHLQEENSDDILLYRAVCENTSSDEFNVLGFDREGHDAAVQKIKGTPINPLQLLLDHYQVGIKDNYRFENIHGQVMKNLTALYRKWKKEEGYDLAILLIKLFALEDDPQRKECYRKHLSLLNDSLALNLCFQ